MRKSQLFSTGAYKEVEDSILSLLNSQADFLSNRTAASTRAAGDAIQTMQFVLVPSLAHQLSDTSRIGILSAQNEPPLPRLSYLQRCTSPSELQSGSYRPRRTWLSAPP